MASITSISGTSSSSSSNAIAYQEYLANLQTKKQQEATLRELKEQSQATPEPPTAAPGASVDRDHDGN